LHGRLLPVAYEMKIFNFVSTTINDVWGWMLCKIAEAFCRWRWLDVLFAAGWRAILVCGDVLMPGSSANAAVFCEPIGDG